jgi:hypothetical protein
VASFEQPALYKVQTPNDFCTVAMFGSTLLAGRVAAFCVYVIRLKRCKCLFAQVKYFDQRFGAGDGFAHNMK